MIGIYKVTSKAEPEKTYIFKAMDMEAWNGSLKAGNHTSKRLQEHYNKYGLDDLTCSLYFPCLKIELAAKEQHFIKKMNPFFNGTDKEAPKKEATKTKKPKK